MRAMRLGLLVFAAFVGTTLASAQGPEAPCTVGVFNMYGYGIGGGKGTTPFTARIKITFEQRLPEGNVVRGVAYLLAARDSAGRTRSESGGQCFRGEDGKPVLDKQINIMDNKERTNLHWQDGSPYMTEKKATLTHFNMQPAPPRPKPTPEELAAMRKAAEARQPPRSEFKTEDLGLRNIAGVEAHGSRTTRTIPAGEEGNELQIVTVDEFWRSDELGLTMLAIRDDPRRGRSVQDVEEVDKEEPVAALFAPPEGYKVVEIKPQVEVPVNPGTVAQ